MSKKTRARTRQRNASNYPFVAAYRRGFGKHRTRPMFRWHERLLIGGIGVIFGVGFVESK